MRLLLDTNAYTALMVGHEAVVSRVRSAEQVLVSSIVAGELLYGFRRGSRYEDNRTQFESFLSHRHVEFLPVTFVTADRFGLIALALRRKGTPIPSNDIWIAAHALETGADLISFDHHFTEIENLAFVHLQSG